MLLSVLRGLAFDVCGLQEVLMTQRDYLARRLGHSDWYGVGRADGLNDGEQSPVVVRRDAVAVHEWHTTWLSQRPDVAGSTGWDAKIPRVATVVRGSLRAAAIEIGIINTHYDHRGQKARILSSELIGAVVREEPSRAWVVMGDFNADLGSGSLDALTASGLRSALPGDVGGTFHGWSGATNRARIDHIFVNDGWDVADAGVSHRKPWGVLASDHWPVFARLRPA